MRVSTAAAEAAATESKLPPGSHVAFTAGYSMLDMSLLPSADRSARMSILSCLLRYVVRYTDIGYSSESIGNARRPIHVILDSHRTIACHQGEAYDDGRIKCMLYTGLLFLKKKSPRQRS